jgi:hypothetical protein
MIANMYKVFWVVRLCFYGLRRSYVLAGWQQAVLVLHGIDELKMLTPYLGIV